MPIAEPQEQEQEVAAQVETTVGDSPAAAEVQTTEALRWFEIVEVPEAGFRCFVRLPNDFQHKDIRDKAMAAKARRVRALKNPATDSFEVLDFEINSIAEADGAEDNLIHEILMERTDRDRYQAIQEVNEDERFEHVRQDQERFRSLSAMASDERPKEEYEEVVEHLASYAEAIEEKLGEIQAPRKEALRAVGLNGLLDKVREKRIAAEGSRVFNDTYLFWQVYACTLQIPEGFDPSNITMESMPRQRVFAEEADLREADPMIVTRVQEAFERLEGAIASITAGNF